MTISRKQALITQIEKYGLQRSGKKEYILYLETKRISAQAAIRAKCYDCCGYYADGAKDCKCPLCPLYPFMPFQKTQVREKRVISDEQKKVVSEHFKKLREAKQK